MCVCVCVCVYFVCIHVKHNVAYMYINVCAC